MTLHPFVGMDESGDLHIYISPFKLHKLSPMHSRGRPFPDGVDQPIPSEKAEELLKKMHDYFNGYENNKRSKKK